MRIYLSLPITGHEETAPQMAEEAKQNLLKVFPKGVEVVTPFEVCHPDEKLDYAACMGRDIEELLRCDAVCVLLNEYTWDSNGVNLEWYAAQKYEKKIYTVAYEEGKWRVYSVSFAPGGDRALGVLINMDEDDED